MNSTKSVLITDKNLSNDVNRDEYKTTAYKDFLALIKIGIVNSNLITAFTGIWLALHFTGQSFLQELDIVLFTLIGSALVIAGSCAINNYYDRDIDHLMDSKKERPTVTGKINPNHVLVMGILLILIGTAFLLLTTVMAAVIGLVGVFSYIFLYTMWSKRRYTINTVIGSISGAVPPLIGWAAIDSNLHLVAWILFLIMFIWQPPHFLALAMKRVDEYKAAGVPMLPVVHGFDITKRQIVIWVLCLFPLPFYLFSLGLPFVILATLLNIGWLFLGIKGFKMKDDLKWAKLMFVYSLNYLTIMFVAMVVVTLV
ncbi:heme o synthase [Fredinandcohnia sp. 179-A 10B2 NHS]|uniref:heme o synthase n=1 Tax=Fredinandcohnia sp. 179-A 10B2 NHS TaxID=3235176 RepID=UPI00399FF719